MKCDGIFPFCGWGKTQTLESIVDDTENKGGGGDLEIVRLYYRTWRSLMVKTHGGATYHVAIQNVLNLDVNWRGGWL